MRNTIVAAAVGLFTLVPVSRGDDAAAAVRALLDEHVEFLKRNDPLGASTKGDERFNDQLPDESPAAVAARFAAVAERLARLRAIDASAVPEPLRTDADLLLYDLSMQVEGARFHGEQTPISTMGGPQLWLPQMASQLPFRTPKHYNDYATRLEKVSALIVQEIEEMRLGLEAGRVPPRVTVAAAVGMCAAQGAVEIEKNPALSPFYKPFLGLPEGDVAAARARKAISGGIVPAYRELAKFLAEEYLPKCRESVGLAQGVDGIAAYDHAVRAHTTLPLTAEEVHATGLSEVARIQAEMLGVIGETEFPRKGELSGEALLRAFGEWLRHEPRFYYGKPEELLNGYRVVAKTVDAELPRLFRLMPRNSYGVRPLPAFAAPVSPAAYYYPGSLKSGVPGYFMANTYKLDQRPKYSMIPLTLHEAVPGHHLQGALADELAEAGGQHEYRRWLGFTAFVEGWGLYSERLGLEMGEGARADKPPVAQSGSAGRGLYADPYDNFGRLSFEMWRACRLVVDTGLHAKGWTRQRAIDYILAHTGLSALDAASEVDRYISWPGQACGYKIGELKIRALRAEAERALGSKFDVRAFHEVVLGAGAVPLPVLEGRVKRWIEGGGR